MSAKQCGYLCLSRLIKNSYRVGFSYEKLSPDLGYIHNGQKNPIKADIR